MKSSMIESKNDIFSNIFEKISEHIYRNKLIKYVNSVTIRHPSVYPLHIFHIVTLACNASCKFCYLKEIKQGSIIDFETLKKYLEHIGHIYCLQLQGGETFLYNNLLNLSKAYLTINYCKRITLITNGSLPQETISYAKDILSFNKKVRLIFYISIDDFPEKHDLARGIKNLSVKIRETLFGLHHLKNPRLTINGIICINKDNIGYIKDIIEYLHISYPFDNIICTIQRKEIIRIIDYDVASLKKLAKTFKEFLYYQNLENILSCKKHTKCLAGLLSCTIMPDGEVKPCELLPSFFKITKYSDLNSDWIKNEKRKSHLESLRYCQCSLECQMGFNVFHDTKNWIPLFFSLLNYKIKNIADIFNHRFYISS